MYDEPLDSLKAATVNNYSIDNGISAVSARGVSPVFDKVNIVLNAPIVAGTVYTITAANVTDCKGNTIGSKNSAKFGISQEADSFDIVINEILFNPKPGVKIMWSCITVHKKSLTLAILILPTATAAMLSAAFNR